MPVGTGHSGQRWADARHANCVCERSLGGLSAGAQGGHDNNARCMHEALVAGRFARFTR